MLKLRFDRYISAMFDLCERLVPPRAGTVHAIPAYNGQPIVSCGEEAKAAVQGIQVAGPAVQAIRVVTETRNLRTQPFTIPGEINAVGKAPRISEASEKKDAMIIYGGNKTARLEKSLLDPETGAAGTHTKPSTAENLQVA